MLPLCGWAHAASGQNNHYQIADLVKQYLDKCMALLQEHALERSRVNWP
jgi:hypothetical protein